MPCGAASRSDSARSYGPARSSRSSSRSGPRARRDLGQQLLGVAPVERRARRGELAPQQLARHQPVERLDVVEHALSGGHAGQPQQRLPLVGHAGLGRQHGRRVVRHVADRELVEREVVVGALTAATARAGSTSAWRVVSLTVDVDRDEEVEPLQRALDPARVRCRARGVAGDRDQRAHLALAGRLDLLRERGDRQLAEALGQPAHARAPAPERDAPAAAGLAGGVALPGGRAREHRAARPVEVPGQHVEHVDQPRGERAELLCRRPDPAIHGGRLGGGELARHAADRRRVDPGRRARRPRA